MKKKQDIMQLIRTFSKGSIVFFVIAVIASLLDVIFNAMMPQAIRITVDSVIGDEAFQLPKPVVALLEQVGGQSYLRSHLWIIVIVVALLALGSGIFHYICRMYISKASEGFVKRMRDTLYAHVQNLPFSWHMKHQTGDIIQRCTSDVEVIRNFVSMQMLEVVHTIFLIVFSLVIMFSMNIKMSLVALAFIPVVFAYSGLFYNKIAKRYLAADEAEGALSAMTQENLTGVRVVRAFGRERFEIDRFDQKNNACANLWIKMGNLTSCYWGIGDLITGLQVVTIVVLGVIEAVQGDLSLGGFMAFVYYNSSLIWPIRSLGRVLADMSKANVSFKRINYILDQAEEQDCDHAIESPMNRDICFKHINFQYEGLKPILKDIDFTIPAGTTFGILGGTGSGKSTLMQLLNRLYDLPEGCGEITIGGVNINQMKRSWVRSQIGMVLQEPFLYSKTIRENIAAVRPQVSLHEVQNMAKIACVDETIGEFAKGYDTLVGERGVTLSGGQKQRVAIARMLLQQAPIMVFDDSLSAVDSETDYKIREALKNNLGNSTVILIAHRITTLMSADMIMVLDDGKISQMGTHEQLISQKGIYKEIYDIQMSSSDHLLTEEKEGI